MALILNDTFTGPDGTSLDSHVSESGHTWSPWNGKGIPGLIKTFGGLSVASSAGINDVVNYFSSAVIGTADVSMTFAGALFAVPGFGPNLIGVFARMTRLYLAGTNGQPSDGYNGYWVHFDGQSGTWYLRRYNSPDNITRNVITELATSAINPIILSEDTTPRTFTFDVTGTAPVRCLLKEGATTIIDFSDTSAGRIVAEGKVGIQMGAYNVDNSARMDSIQASSVVAAATVPGAPTIGAATAGVTSANVAFTAPASNGGAAITGYLGTASTGETASNPTSPISFPSLTANVPRTFHVQAINTVGTGAASAESNSVTPTASNPPPTFPGVIANIVGTGGTAIAAVNVSSQFADSGDTLTYTASPGATAWPSGLVVNPSTGFISGTVATSTTAGLKVRATDTANQSIDSNAFSVTISAPASTVSGVTVSPATATVTGGSTQALSAAVAGAGGPSQAVNWTIAGGGTVNSAGVVTAPATTSSAQILTVTATSAQDATKSGSATITVPAATGVTFTPIKPLGRANGGALRTALAMRVSVLTPGTDVPIVTVASITTHATTGVPPPFTVSGPVAGNSYAVKMTNLANEDDVALFSLTPT